MTGTKAVGGAGLQTLERGLSVLEAVAAAYPCSTADVASATGLHRSIAYRVLCTLEARGYLRRDASGRYEVGQAVLTVAAAVQSDLRSVARVELARVAEALGATAFLAVPHEQVALTLVTAEPPASVAPVAYRPGVRHPLTRGAPGLAILAAWPARADERPEVTLGRELGHVRTTGEVLPGTTAIAVPVQLRGDRVASVCAMAAQDQLREDEAVPLLTAVAERLQIC